MIVYGHRATKTGHQSLFGVKCGHCEAKDSLEMYTFSRYAHIFWIPLFPYKKEAVTQCNHCKEILSKKEFSSDLLAKYEEMKLNIKTPYWQFIGLAAIALLVTLGIYTGIQDDKRDKAFLNAPKPGDIYEIKTKGGQYTLFKVAEVKKDSVYVMFNQFETNKKSGLSSKEFIQEDSYVQDEYMPFSKSDLLKMKESGEIQGVKRYGN
jgi:hypothetical protein